MLAIFGVAITCAGTATLTSVEETPVLEPPAPDPPPPPPFVEPPPPARMTLQLPDYGRTNPPFPYFPGENRHRSLSIGTVTGGYLVNARRLPSPHPHLTTLPRQYQRGFQYAGDPLVQLVADAADHVGEKYPDARVPLGNFSRKGGGNIPQSVSHNNGRDADIAFFVIDEEGQPTNPPDLLKFDEHGRFEGTFNGEELVLEFDVERNWRLVEGLIESDGADIQYIFVSNPLRRMLLAEARRQGASASTLRIASRVLVQPGGNALPHDDHFHLRIHCTAEDFAAGCRERGRPGPTFTADLALKRGAIERAANYLDGDDPELRLVAIRRLELLENHRLHARIADHIEDSDPRVRAAAVRALRNHTNYRDLLIDRLHEEEDPRVFAEVARSLTYHGDDAVQPLIAALGRNKPLSTGLAAGEFISTDALVADALATLEHPDAVPELIATLDGAHPPTMPQLVHALRILTNHQFFDDLDPRDETRRAEIIDTWTRWWEENQEFDHSQWVAAGFRQAGYNVESLDSDDVWELCRAISDERHLNVNAQRVLKRLSGQSPGSLQWDPYDASFYWRRWFERRQDQFALPPIPTELSTADGYTPPER